MAEIRTLGLAVRARWLGFAELDEEESLLDWGIFFYQKRSVQALRSVQKRLEALISRVNPSHIVLVRPELKIHEQSNPAKSIGRNLHAFGLSQSIKISTTSRVEIRTAFLGGNRGNKDKIASLLTQVFPELSAKLPAERKVWEKEDARMALFDALAGAIAFQRRIQGKPCAFRSAPR